jgi:sn-glycerol 3-phosphate transport system permease protein
VPIGLIIALFLALIANEKLKGIGFFRTMFSSTMGMSVAASSVIWMFMYNPTIGVINKVLNLVGIHDVQWLLDPKYALIAVSISTIWMNIGFTFLILLGGLQNIDEKLYENARIAGVSYWYQLRKITLPMLSPTLFFIITVSFINAFQTFGQIDILTKGGPTDSTNVIVYSIYKDAFVNYNVGSASAQATILFFCILLVTALQFKLGERKVHYQ